MARFRMAAAILLALAPVMAMAQKKATKPSANANRMADVLPFQATEKTTATQDQQIGYALDSKWYGIGEYTSYVRDRLKTLTLEDVNAAIRRHLSAKDVSVVIVTKDAKGLREKLVSDEFSPIHYDAEKPATLLEEDKVIGSLKLAIKPENVKITPVEDVFAK